MEPEFARDHLLALSCEAWVQADSTSLLVPSQLPA